MNMNDIEKKSVKLDQLKNEILNDVYNHRINFLIFVDSKIYFF